MRNYVKTKEGRNAGNRYGSCGVLAIAAIKGMRYEDATAWTIKNNMFDKKTIFVEVGPYTHTQALPQPWPWPWLWSWPWPWPWPMLTICDAKYTDGRLNKKSS